VSADPSGGRSNAPAVGTDVCAFADVADGQSRVVIFGKDWTAFELIVVRTGEHVWGYVNECKHMPLPLNLLDDHAVETVKHHFLCDHHCARFRFSDGYCVEGPCEGQSLDAVPLAVRGSRVVIAGAPQPR
jgi:nitrite reductase/ring-hydroxylating ferredoxin subunit